VVRGRKPRRVASGDDSTRGMSSERMASPTRPSQAEKRTASRFYQLKSGHALTGVYLKSTDNRPDDHCWWCDPENDSGTHQTRDHLVKHCHKWKVQQAAMWARVKEETKKGKQKWRVGGLLADDRCSPAVSGGFLRSDHVGGRLHRRRKTGTVRDRGIQGKQGRMECRRRRQMEWRSKRNSDPQAPGIGFPWCGIGFLPFVISLVRPWCVISFGERGGARELPTEPVLGCSRIRAGRQTGLG